ncbi:MAG: biotin--[Clostridia bacterium]|nr:biotin--[acetyl-CoA-carboxylase] ligase [Clostridia bacterium]
MNGTEYDKASDIRWLPEVGSTNEALKQAVLGGADIPDGAAWATTRQTAGRGRRGRSWEMPDGQALALSVWMTGAPDPTASLLLGLAVTRALRRLTGADFELKWPNDSICGGRKVGGLLCEAICMGGVQGTVLGAGLNLLQGAEFFKQAGLPYGGSVRMLTGAEISPRQAAEAVCREWQAIADRFRAEGFVPFRAEYESVCATVGREVRVLNADGTEAFSGTAIGVDETGALRVQTARAVKTCRAGEVSVRGLYGYV